MIDRARSADNLVVRERRGVRTFWVTRRAGRVRHSILIGSERESLCERSAARAVRLILAWPAPPTPSLVRILVRWVIALEGEHADG